MTLHRFKGQIGYEILPTRTLKQGLNENSIFGKFPFDGFIWGYFMFCCYISHVILTVKSKGSYDICNYPFSDALLSKQFNKFCQALEQWLPQWLICSRGTARCLPRNHCALQRILGSVLECKLASCLQCTYCGRTHVHQCNVHTEGKMTPIFTVLLLLDLFVVVDFCLYPAFLHTGTKSGLWHKN